MVKSINQTIKSNSKYVIKNKPIKKRCTHKGRLVLESREPQLHERVSKCLFARGTRCSDPAKSLHLDLYKLRSPHSKILGRKQQDVDLFRDCNPLEYLTSKNDCNLFCYGATNKQRPFRLFFGRLFEDTCLDMYEAHITAYKALREFDSKLQPPLGSKPIIITEGAEFESCDLFKSFRNYMIHFFAIGDPRKLLVNGVNQVIVLSAVDGPRVCFRRYRLTKPITSVAAISNVELVEIGPAFTMVLERFVLPDPERWKMATRIPKPQKPKKIKNVESNVMGETYGRVHVGKQDLSKLYTPHHSKKHPKKKHQE